MSRLVENAVNILGISTRYNLVEEYAAPEEEERPSWMPRTLHDFMFHLSQPSDPHGKKLRLNEEVDINEVTLIDNRPKKPAGGLPGAAASAIPSPHQEVHEYMHLPKTAHVIAHGRATMPEGNIHKRIGEGFRAAYDSMDKEDPKTQKAKVSESRKVFQKFAQDRGYKAKTAPKMLMGNLKTKKSSGEGVRTTGLNLAPHATHGLHGFDVCPKASSECRSGCLGLTAGGNKQYPDNSLSSKVLRTHFIAHHPEHAARIIDHEIGLHKKRAAKEGMQAGVRMNITSDLAWEHHAPKMFEKHKDVQFYDYTKMPNRVMRSLAPKNHPDDFHNKLGHPSNYHLTLSHTGTGHSESNDKDVIKVLDHGGTVASVFQKAKGGHLPTHIEDAKTGKRYPVKNGDDDDNTFDRPNAVSGLKLKGIKNSEAGHFANKVDDDRIARINKD